MFTVQAARDSVCDSDLGILTFPLLTGEVCGVPLPYEASSASGSHRGSQEELDRSSSCSFASVLCPTPLMEPSLGLLPPSQDVVQAQIAKLAQQNVQMRDQLEQRRISPAGSYSSREQTSGRSSPASLSRQRTAPSSGHQPQVQQVQTSEQFCRI